MLCLTGASVQLKWNSRSTETIDNGIMKSWFLWSSATLFFRITNRFVNHTFIRIPVVQNVSMHWYQTNVANDIRAFCPKTGFPCTIRVLFASMFVVDCVLRTDFVLTHSIRFHVVLFMLLQLCMCVCWRSVIRWCKQILIFKCPLLAFSFRPFFSLFLLFFSFVFVLFFIF